MRRGLHDEQVDLRLAVRPLAHLHDDAARLREARRQGRDLAREPRPFRVVPDAPGVTGRGREPAQRAVVGVGDDDAPVGQRRDPERVLHQRLLGRAVAVTEVEQPLPDGGPHLDALGHHGDATAQPGHAAQRRGLGVGDPDGAVGCDRQPGRLGEPGRRPRPVLQTLVHRPGQQPELPPVEGPQRVMARHRHDEARQLVRPGDVPRR
ncbi:Uncharacterised protein [Mycobacteroides abscessus]|nr:Uncharacterised protein [Mycobacteroides abscessus]